MSEDTDARHRHDSCPCGFRDAWPEGLDAAPAEAEAGSRAGLSARNAPRVRGRPL